MFALYRIAESGHCRSRPNGHVTFGPRREALRLISVLISLTGFPNPLIKGFVTARALAEKLEAL